MDILDLIASDNYIPYNRTLAKEIGVENAIVFGALCGYQRKFKGEEFFREQEKIMDDTALTEYAVRKAIKELRELGLINVVKKGLPAKFYYQINMKRVIEYLSTSGYENNTTGSNENNTTSNNEKISTNIIKNNNKKEYNNDILSFWNSKHIIEHKASEEIDKAVCKAVRKYTVKQIKQAIEHYSIIYHDENYWFKYKWTLIEFLKQKNALPDFLDNGSKWLNYQANGKPTQNFIHNNYSSELINGFYSNLDEIEV